ncbi:DUF2752 domain-containing protein [Mariniflexile maritimum]|uniref:DUF2752 domain-containing protein n=1 Tax=Mariniflexile maritimum TaxID=2682493 RepID=UPI0012F67117|nr:DUF2752 domain-containing protein [Mariniflexile maritimum]HMQ43343.1 DUF2752 domain-containing protein [Mariniflexile sp.]HMR15704.1 DUF2752 domain-containing protein [Mariniflexile sp.]
MQTLDDYMLPCLNKKLFGFECMGCGMQRSVSLLFHGEFMAAFKMYPAIYTLIPLILFIGMNFFFKFKNSDKIITILSVATIAIIITSYVIKLTN